MALFADPAVMLRHFFVSARFAFVFRWFVSVFRPVFCDTIVFKNLEQFPAVCREHRRKPCDKIARVFSRSHAHGGPRGFRVIGAKCSMDELKLQARRSSSARSIMTINSFPTGARVGTRDTHDIPRARPLRKSLCKAKVRRIDRKLRKACVLAFAWWSKRTLRARGLPDCVPAALDHKCAKYNRKVVIARLRSEVLSRD